MKLCVGERNNIHRCVAHQAILYFPLAILINYSANLNIYVEEQSLAKYTQNSSNVFWEIQCGVTCYTTAEIRAFFNAQFQSRVISCTAKVKWLPYSLNLPWFFWSYTLFHLRKQKPLIINGLKKTFKDMVHIIPEQMIQDQVGNIHKKCNAHKQAEGDHFKSFL